MAWVPAQDDMAWKRASTGRGSMPPQKTSFEPHARPPDSFRKPRQGDLILFSQISSIRNEGRHEVVMAIRLHHCPRRTNWRLAIFDTVHIKASYGASSQPADFS